MCYTRVAVSDQYTRHPRRKQALWMGRTAPVHCCYSSGVVTQEAEPAERGKRGIQITGSSRIFYKQGYRPVLSATPGAPPLHVVTGRTEAGVLQ